MHAMWVPSGLVKMKFKCIYRFRFAILSNSGQFQYDGTVAGSPKGGQNVGGRRRHVCQLLFPRACAQYIKVNILRVYHKIYFFFKVKLAQETL